MSLQWMYRNSIRWIRVHPPVVFFKMHKITFSALSDVVEEFSV